jgi:hypothetical protein
MSDPLTQAVAESLVEVRDLATRCHDRLNVEPALPVFCQARALIDLDKVLTRLREVAAAFGE